MNVQLRLASEDNLPELLSFVQLYHEFESIEIDDLQREQAVNPLLNQRPFGRMWLIESAGEWVGYIVICFGYTIELGGRDAFLDEFYIHRSCRGNGIGAEVLRLVEAKAKK